MYDELVKALRVCADGEHCSKCPKWELKLNAGRNACEYAICTEAADAIEELMRRCEQFQYMPPPAWIPVTEEPPLKVGDDGYNGYLVYANGYYEVADYTTDKFDNVPYFHVNGEYESGVTHWMPLPEPPVEG